MLTSVIYHYNTRIYNLISFPQITRFLLEDQTYVVAARSRGELIAKVEITKQCQGCFHLLHLFTLNNKPIFFRAFPV